MRKVFCLFFFAAVLVAGGKNESSSDKNESSMQENDEVVVIRVFKGQGQTAAYNAERVKVFNESQDRIRVDNTVEAPRSVTDLYALMLQMFEAQQDTVDILPIDTIWPGDLAEHLLDLNPLGGDELAEKMFKGLVDNNRLDGRLLALPTLNTAGILFYRKDLLEKYGYSGPPLTWDELEEMSRTVQEGERATHPNFWGYAWQGAAYEGLVCNVLEWTYSNGDDVWVNSDRQITINNPKNIAILERAKSWVGTISPPAVLAFQEDESQALFQTGNALFLRNWFYVYSIANRDDSPLKGLVGIASVPAGDSGHGAATIGAWSVGINKYSKHPKEAFEYIKFILSYEETLLKAEGTSEFPPYTAAYEDEEFLEKVPAVELLSPVFANSIARPSTVTAPNYNAVSTLVSRSVNSILAGKTDTADALEELAFEIQDITGYEIVN